MTRALAPFALAATVLLTACGAGGSEYVEASPSTAGPGPLCGPLPTEAVRALAGRTAGLAPADDLSEVDDGAAVCRIVDAKSGEKFASVVVSERFLGRPAEARAWVKENESGFCTDSDRRQADLGSTGYFCLGPSALIAEEARGSRTFRLLSDSSRAEGLRPEQVDAWFTAIERGVEAAQEDR